MKTKLLKKLRKQFVIQKSGNKYRYTLTVFFTWFQYPDRCFSDWRYIDKNTAIKRCNDLLLDYARSNYTKPQQTITL